MRKIYPPDESDAGGDTIRMGPSSQVESQEIPAGPAPQIQMSIVSTATLGNYIYAFSATGTVWRISVNPFEIYELYVSS
jgi:hypothetical protein